MKNQKAAFSTSSAGSSVARGRLAGALLASVITAAAWGQDENLSEMATAVCELPHLAVAPPSPWYSVPVESNEQLGAGCQMIWEEGNQYMGIMRLVAFETKTIPADQPSWEQAVIGFEVAVMKRMGIVVGDPIWSRDSLPISGEGFENAKAVGMKANLEGLDQQNEVHFLLFENASHKYVFSSLTPSQSVSPDIYAANTGAMSTIMRTLQPR